MKLQTCSAFCAAYFQNNVVVELGTADYPWQLTVSLRAGTGHPNAVLNGTLDVNVTDGWFNFTDLTISHMGSGYILDFNVTYPPEAENFTLASDPFDVDGRPVKVHVVDKSSGDIVRNAQFFMTLDLRDGESDEIIEDITWRVSLHVLCPCCVDKTQNDFLTPFVELSLFLHSRVLTSSLP